MSVDIESGYGEAPARLIDGLLGAGAVGLNIEDTVHSEGGRLRSSAEHAELVGALRAAADAAGVHVVINARTDLFIRQDGDEADRVDRAIARLTEAADAGADVLYPVGRHDPDTLRRLTAELPLPVNAIAMPDQSDPASYGPLGVGRISFGPFLQAALTGANPGDPGSLDLAPRHPNPVEPLGLHRIRCRESYLLSIAMRCASVPLWAPATRTVSTPASYDAEIASPVTCAGSLNDRRNEP